MRRSILVLAGLLTASPLFAAPAASPGSAVAPTGKAPTVLRRFEAEDGRFIDDPFALRQDGGALAYVTSDGVSGHSLHLVDLAGGAKPVHHPLELGASALHWLGRDRVLVVFRDEEQGTVTAQAFGPRGADKARLGPAGEIALGTVGGKAVVLTYTLSSNELSEHSITAHRTDNLKLLQRKLLREDREGRVSVGGQAIKPLWWVDGFSILAGLLPGGYDKAKDLRRPDRFVKLDVFSGQRSDEREIEDVLAFAHLAADHRARRNTSVFAHLTEDRARLELVDGISEHVLELARPLSLYEARSLAYQTLDARRVLLSMTVDPLNPPALKRKKPDPDQIDLYEVDRTTHRASLRLRLDGEGRRSTWHAGGGKLALLRKGKGFDRGGVVLELYELGAAR